MSLHCQFIWIWNHLEVTHLYLTVKHFQRCPAQEGMAVLDVAAPSHQQRAHRTEENKDSKGHAELQPALLSVPLLPAYRLNRISCLALMKP